MDNKKINSKIKLSNNSSYVILIFVILKFRNIGRSTFRRSKFWPPPEFSNFDIICDAIREKGPTIQKIDFRIMCDPISLWTDHLWGAIRNFLSTSFCKAWIIEKEFLHAFRAVLISLIARHINFHFWIVGPFSRIASHIRIQWPKKTPKYTLSTKL